MNAIYRCSVEGGDVVEIDADTDDSVGVIKNLVWIAHKKKAIEVLTEMPIRDKYGGIDAKSIPQSLRRFIDLHMGCHEDLIGIYSEYVIKHKTDPKKYKKLLAKFLKREKEENQRRDEEIEAAKLRAARGKPDAKAKSTA